MIDPVTLDWDDLNAERDSARAKTIGLFTRRARRAKSVPHQLATAYGMLFATAQAFMATKAGDVPASLMAETFVAAAREAADEAKAAAESAGLGGTGGRA